MIDNSVKKKKTAKKKYGKFNRVDDKESVVFGGTNGSLLTYKGDTFNRRKVNTFFKKIGCHGDSYYCSKSCSHCKKYHAIKVLREEGTKKVLECYYNGCEGRTERTREIANIPVNLVSSPPSIPGSSPNSQVFERDLETVNITSEDYPTQYNSPQFAFSNEKSKKRKYNDKDFWKTKKFEIVGLVPARGSVEGSQNEKVTELFFSIPVDPYMKLLEWEPGEADIYFGKNKAKLQADLALPANKNNRLKQNGSEYIKQKADFWINLEVPPAYDKRGGFVDVVLRIKGIRTKRDQGYEYIGITNMENPIEDLKTRHEEEEEEDVETVEKKSKIFPNYPSHDLFGYEIDYENCDDNFFDVIQDYNRMTEVETQVLTPPSSIESSDSANSVQIEDPTYNLEDLEESNVDIFGRNCMFYIIAQNRYDDLVFLVEKRKFRVDVADIMGCTLLDTAEYFNHQNIILYLQEKTPKNLKRKTFARVKDEISKGTAVARRADLVESTNANDMKDGPKTNVFGSSRPNFKCIVDHIFALNKESDGDGNSMIVLSLVKSSSVYKLVLNRVTFATEEEESIMTKLFSIGVDSMLKIEGSKNHTLKISYLSKKTLRRIRSGRKIYEVTKDEMLRYAEEARNIEMKFSSLVDFGSVLRTLRDAKAAFHSSNASVFERVKKKAEEEVEGEDIDIVTREKMLELEEEKKYPRNRVVKMKKSIEKEEPKKKKKKKKKKKNGGLSDLSGGKHRVAKEEAKEDKKARFPTRWYDKPPEEWTHEEKMNFIDFLFIQPKSNGKIVKLSEFMKKKKWYGVVSEYLKEGGVLELHKVCMRKPKKRKDTKEEKTIRHLDGEIRKVLCQEIERMFVKVDKTKKEKKKKDEKKKMKKFDVCRYRVLEKLTRCNKNLYKKEETEEEEEDGEEERVDKMTLEEINQLLDEKRHYFDEHESIYNLISHMLYHRSFNELPEFLEKKYNTFKKKMRRENGNNPLAENEVIKEFNEHRLISIQNISYDLYLKNSTRNETEEVILDKKQFEKSEIARYSLRNHLRRLMEHDSQVSNEGMNEIGVRYVLAMNDETKDVQTYISLASCRIHYDTETSLVDIRSDNLEGHHEIFAVDAFCSMILNPFGYMDTLRRVCERVMLTNVNFEESLNSEVFARRSVDAFGSPGFYERVHDYIDYFNKNWRDCSFEDPKLRRFEMSTEFFERFGKLIKKGGKFEILEKLKKRFMKKPKKFAECFFRSHGEVDNFAKICFKEDPNFDITFSEEYQVLKSFDRAFWSNLRDSRTRSDERLIKICEPHGICPFVSVEELEKECEL